MPLRVPTSAVLVVLALAAAQSASFATRADATSVPMSYPAVTNRAAYPEPALPSLGAAGTRFTDPTFGTRVLRVSDANTRPGSPGRSFTTPSAAHQLAWSASSDRFSIRSIDGTFIPYDFDPITMTASRIAPSGTGDGGLTISSQVEPQFSFRSSNILFASRQDPVNDWPIVRQFDFTTRAYTDIANLGTLTTIDQETYAGALSSSATDPEKLAVMFGGIQDRHYKVAVFQVSPPGADPVVLDTWASTITGAGPPEPTNIPLNFFLHHAWMDQSGRYVLLYRVNEEPLHGHHVGRGAVAVSRAGRVRLDERPREPRVDARRDLPRGPHVVEQRPVRHARADPVSAVSLLRQARSPTARSRQGARASAWCTSRSCETVWSTSRRGEDYDGMS